MRYTILHTKNGLYVLIDEDKHKVVGYYDTYEEAKEDAEREEDNDYDTYSSV